jgi:glutathione peroxidase
VSARIVSKVLAPAALIGVFALAAIAEGPAKEKSAVASSVLQFQVKDINGKPVDLAKFKGEVLLIVNTASFCGYTDQYNGLEAIYEKYKGKGFEILAFPANEFGKQEPGSNAEIKTFCSSTYKVSFPLFSKVVAKGAGIDPVYKFLTSPETDPKFAGEITWNFNKFLVNRKGEVIARFASGDAPESAKVIKAVETALAEPK